MSIHSITGETPEGFTEVSHEFASAVAHKESPAEELATFNLVVEDHDTARNALGEAPWSM
jgi:hypothetical protein